VQITGITCACFFGGLLGAFGAGAGAGLSCGRGVGIDAAGLAAHQSEGRERFLFKTSSSGAWNTLDCAFNRWAMRSYHNCDCRVVEC
jgi:hypothetical protein